MVDGPVAQRAVGKPRDVTLRARDVITPACAACAASVYTRRIGSASVKMTRCAKVANLEVVAWRPCNPHNLERVKGIPGQSV